MWKKKGWSFNEKKRGGKGKRSFLSSGKSRRCGRRGVWRVGLVPREKALSRKKRKREDHEIAKKKGCKKQRTLGTRHPGEEEEKASTRGGGLKPWGGEKKVGVA